jgi:hypothetical protein
VKSELETVSIVQRPERAPTFVFVLLGETTLSLDVPEAGTLRIGRGEDCEIRVDHRSVSRLHAEIQCGDPPLIVDRGSRNGTIVRGQRLSGSTPLHVGDVIECGEALLVLRARVASDATRGIVVGPEAHWLEVDGARVNLGRRGALRRVLAHLVDRRIGEPGSRASVAELLEAGWPGERMQWEAGVARVYTTVQRLRALGLEGILLTRDDGYLLDPAITCMMSIEKSAFRR